MGFSIPAAIGAKAAFPDRMVWPVDGDGSFQKTGQDMITASVENIPIKVALLNNAYLGMVRQWQELFYEERYSEVHLGFDTPDYVKWAESMGCVAFRVEDPDEVEVTIAKANEITDRPVVVEFRCLSEEKVYPMVPAGGSNDDILVDPTQRDQAPGAPHPNPNDPQGAQ
jgi:acetolactate synthase-1/2/3 large subunit